MTMPSKSTGILEALLLATDRPLPASRLASVIPRVRESEIAGMAIELNRCYEDTGRAFRVREVAGGYRLFTHPDYESYVDALAVTTRETRLSQAALETLAVVAYRQPVSKNDVEYVRGCDCDGVLRTLLSRRLVSIKGRSEAPGRPLLYATTDRFLEYFGLAEISDLPDWSEIAALVGDAVPQSRLTLVRGAEPDLETDAEGEQPASPPIEEVVTEAHDEAFEEEDLPAGELVVTVPREDAT